MIALQLEGSSNPIISTNLNKAIFSIIYKWNVWVIKFYCEKIKFLHVIDENQTHGLFKDYKRVKRHNFLWANCVN